MNYIVYSNTDYIDILTVHTDYLKFDNNILFINKNNLDLSSIYNKYKKVIFYDDALPYASRLLTCIEQIDNDYFLLIHDIDIPLFIDENRINSIYEYAISNNIDRVDLQQDIRVNRNETISEIIEIDNFNEINNHEINNYDHSLVKNDNISNYIYNVNPSIWKKDSLYQLLSNFRYETYRTIEGRHVQEFCLRFKIYKINSKQKMNSGYFSITPLFQFLHITHGGGLMPVNNIINGADVHINNEYIKILQKYKFNRPIKNMMH
jgi:hypothetical protein